MFNISMKQYKWIELFTNLKKKTLCITNLRSLSFYFIIVYVKKRILNECKSSVLVLILRIAGNIHWGQIKTMCYIKLLLC